MSVPSLLESFHLHLRARGLRPLTQDRYVYGAERLHRHAGKPAEAVSGSAGCAFLVHVGNEKALRRRRRRSTGWRLHAVPLSIVNHRGAGDPLKSSAHQLCCLC